MAVTLRWQLLTMLPIADVCLLEEGPFVQGIDMERCLIILEKTWAHQVGKSVKFSASLDYIHVAVTGRNTEDYSFPFVHIF